MSDMRYYSNNTSNAANSTNSINAINNDYVYTGNKSIQMIFAELQIELAKDRKAGAASIIDTIKKQQDLSKRYANCIKNLRGAYTNTKDGGDENKARMNAIKKYKDEVAALGVSTKYFDGDSISPTQLDKMINDLQTLQDQVGSDIQQKMIYVQDLMGQYNAYTQGANSAINTGNQVLTAVARGQ